MGRRSPTTRAIVGNVPVSRDFMGRGIVNAELEADGIVANVVLVSFL